MTTSPLTPDEIAGLVERLRCAARVHAAGWIDPSQLLEWKAADALESAARAQVAQPQDGWQDIASAPRGGLNPTRIILRFGSEAVSVAYWDDYYAPGGRGCTDGFAWIEPCSCDPLNLHYSNDPDGWKPIVLPQPSTEMEKG